MLSRIIPELTVSRMVVGGTLFQTNNLHTDLSIFAGYYYIICTLGNCKTIFQDFDGILKTYFIKDMKNMSIFIFGKNLPTTFYIFIRFLVY